MMRHCSIGQEHVTALHRLGLHPIPCWGGGRYLPGTKLRELADHPPDLEAVISADYHGGLAILCGTLHPAGGANVGLDIDRGPEQLMPLPCGSLYRELGTAPGKLHEFVRTTDRLDGQIIVRDSGGGIVAEIKGRGYALRSWPTRPPGKPRGYTPVVMARDPSSDPPRLTAEQVAEGLADYLGRALGEKLLIDRQRPGTPGRAYTVSAGLAGRVAAELGARETGLRSSGRDGWQLGWCPFHEDRRTGQRSFSVSLALGVWKCWSGCGSGGLRGLAEKLGLAVYRWHDGRPLLPEVWS